MFNKKLKEELETIRWKYDALFNRIKRVEEHFKTKPIYFVGCKNWKELAVLIKKELKGYKPKEVSKIVIEGNWIEVTTYPYIKEIKENKNREKIKVKEK